MIAPEQAGRNVADVVRALRRLKPISQKALGDEILLDESTMSRCMHGKRSWQVEEVARLAAFFEVSPSTFFRPAAEINAAIDEHLQKLEFLSLVDSEHQPELFETDHGRELAVPWFTPPSLTVAS